MELGPAIEKYRKLNQQGQRVMLLRVPRGRGEPDGYIVKSLDWIRRRIKVKPRNWTIIPDKFVPKGNIADYWWAK